MSIERAGRVLVVDDDPVSCCLVAEALRADGFDVVAAHDPAEALAAHVAQPVDFAILDMQLPGTTGLSLVASLRDRQPRLPVIVITAFGSVETAVEAVSSGVIDYVSKPLDLPRLSSTVRRTLAAAPEATIPVAADPTDDGETLVGRSPAMVDVYKTIATVARGPATVLILGESGTGKELVARAIHRHGPSAQRPLIAVDCAAMPEPLLEAELFGHVRGAFTGAIADREGLFAAADGGTIFLDEIGELPLALQAKLLRVLQEQQIRPIGSTQWRSVHVRVLAASNRDLGAEVRAGRFREDLFYRLKVVTIGLPPLRERREDIALLSEHLLGRLSRRHGKALAYLTPAALARLTAYDWPGNVRELTHVLERLVALVPRREIDVDDLPPEFQSAGYSTPAGLMADRPTLEELKRRYVALVLRENDGNVTRTATMLGVDRRSFYRTLQAYGLAGERPDDE